MSEILLEHGRIAADAPPYLIAEIGLNHNGDFDLARRIADAAAESGAHAAKFQLYRSECFLHPQAPLGDGPPGGLAEFFRQFELRERDWPRLAEHVRALGLDFFCSVFDAPSFELYASLDARAVKVASCDIDNALLFEAIARGSWAVFLSTGTASEAEVDRAVFEWLPADRPRLVMECVSSYPAAPADYRLRLLLRWRDRFGLVGLSDHSETNALSFSAAALGATAIERHFTLSRDLPGPDQKLSLDPPDLRALADGLRAVYAALRSAPEKTPRESERGPLQFGRRSLYAARAISAGQRLTPEDLIAQRPGSAGAPADAARTLYGLQAPADLPAGAPIPVAWTEAAEERA